MDALPALAEMVEQGATAEGDDKNSVASAAMLVIDLATEGGLPIEKARCVVLDFDDNGDVSVSVVEDSAAPRVRECLTGDGVTSGTVSAADIEKAFEDAAEIEGRMGGEDGEDRPSTPPPPPPPPAAPAA